MLLRRQLRLAGATAAVSFSRHRRYCFDAPAARGFIRQAPHRVGLFGWSGLSDLFGLFAWSVCWLVYWFVLLVWCLWSWGLLVSSVYRSLLEVGLSGWFGLSIAMSIGMVV